MEVATACQCRFAAEPMGGSSWRQHSFPRSTNSVVSGSPIFENANVLSLFRGPLGTAITNYGVFGRLGLDLCLGLIDVTKGSENSDH